MVMRAVGQILGRRIVSLTLDSSTGSSFSGGLCLYDPSSPHAVQSLCVAEPGVVTDWDGVVCNSGNLHFDACPRTLPGASTAPAGGALPVSFQSPQRSPADRSTTADAEDGALRGDPLDQADAGAAATIRADRFDGTRAPSARAGVYAHASNCLVMCRRIASGPQAPVASRLCSSIQARQGRESRGCGRLRGLRGLAIGGGRRRFRRTCGRNSPSRHLARTLLAWRRCRRECGGGAWPRWYAPAQYISTTTWYAHAQYISTCARAPARAPAC
jgi:hypothetical protein